MKKFKIYLQFFLLFLLLFSGLIVITDSLIRLSTAKQISNNVLLMPDNALVLVPGSGTTTDPASPNYSFSFRMKKTTELFKTGKTKKIIVSGISNKIFYNEPNDMKNKLISFGIPARIIYPDHGGTRTFLSVKRVKLHGDIQMLIIISQRKQLERALFIANCLNIPAKGLEADQVPFQVSPQEEFHELLSRVKCVAECLIN